MALMEASKASFQFQWLYFDLTVGLETSDLLSPEEIADCLKQGLPEQANLRVERNCTAPGILRSAVSEFDFP